MPSVAADVHDAVGSDCLRASLAADSRPAHVELMQIVSAIWLARAVYAAAHLGLADLLADGPQTTDELARATGTHAPSLHRLLRALASRGVFAELEPRRFSLTPLGAALRRDAFGAARATVLTLGGDWQWKAWDNFVYSLQTGRPALDKVAGVGLFDYLAAHPDDQARFNDAMAGIHGTVDPFVVSAYDFSPFKTVVDVGGGTGTLLTTILRCNETLRGILYELPEAAAVARRALLGSELASRCVVLEGDFFEAVPRGHDAYILSHVLHDWTDEQALPILRNCRHAMADHGRLLVVDAVLPPGNVPHNGKLMDLLMLTVTGGVERTEKEFAVLLAAAGFAMTRVLPTLTDNSIIEAVPL